MSDALPDEACLELLRIGDEGAARALFDRYVDQVLKLARRRIQRLRRRIDAEDVAQSVFRTFFDRARKGQFEMKDSDDLCKLLARITVRKTFRQIAYHLRGKRSAGGEVAGGDSTEKILRDKLDQGPTPDEAATFLDELQHVLSQLRPEDQKILELRLEGYNNVEIAEQLGVSDRKIRRLMERLRNSAQEGEAAT